jgi:aminoglycoside phosphotransferase (APT) family kinase protein
VAAGSVNAAHTVVPAAHREVVRAALTAVLGAAPIDTIKPVSAGISAGMLLRVESRARSYLVRIEGPRSPLRYPHQYESMRIAAEAGIAPRVHYIDEANGIAVMDFVEERPLRSYPGGRVALVIALGALLRRLNQMPAFPPFIGYPEIVARLFAHVRRTGLFVTGLLDRHAEHLEHIRAEYDWEAERSVSCHNDLYARNILFDGNRLWLIDWESAYPNDPLVDVAILLDNVATSSEEQNALLGAWLGRAADDARQARLTQARAFSRLYYAGVLLSRSARYPRPTPDTDLAAPTLTEFETAIRQGRHERGTLETVHVMGKMYLNGFLTDAAVPPLVEI